MIELPDLDFSRPIVGYDIGSSFGHCVLYGETNAETGTWDFRPDPNGGGGMRFLRSHRAIKAHLLEHRPCIVAYELVRSHRRAGQMSHNVQAAQLYGAWKAQILQITEELGIPCTHAAVGEIKKFATGKGNASKAKMVQATKDALPFWDGTEDAADAYWIARCVRARELG